MNSLVEKEKYLEKKAKIVANEILSEKIAVEKLKIEGKSTSSSTTNSIFFLIQICFDFLLTIQMRRKFRF